jgi:hypothetical protein
MGTTPDAIAEEAGVEVRSGSATPQFGSHSSCFSTSLDSGFDTMEATRGRMM